MVAGSIIGECLRAMSRAVDQAKKGADGVVVFNNHGIKIEIRGGSMVAVSYIGSPKDTYLWDQLVAHANSLRAGELKKRTPRGRDWEMSFPAGN